MPVFHLANDKLIQIKEKKVDLERNIQKLTELNLETIFGLKFVSGSLNSEFSVRAQEQDFYIDTLAIDEAQRSIVIIEYKKDKSFSVIDQGFAYLSAMLNHKADFVLEINERLKKNFTKKDIDWEQSRIIFISPEFTNYQRNAINFKDLPIYLYEVRLYENDLYEFDPIKPYRTTESISSISKDKTIQEVSREVKSLTFQDHLLKVSPDLKDLFIRLHDELLNIGEDIKENVTTNYVGFRFHGTNYASIAYHSGKIIFHFRTKTKPDTTLKVNKLLQSAWDKTPLWRAYITEDAQLPQALEIARHAYRDYADRLKKQ